MRARALGSRQPAPARLPGRSRSATTSGLVFLRGRDADGRLRELGAAQRATRPVLGALAIEMVGRRRYETLGYRSLGDYARERLGVEARTVREWGRVWRHLEALPLLRGALLAGEIGFSVARLVVGLATPDTDAACLATLRGRTLRAVREIVRAVQEAEAGAGPALDASEAGSDADDESQDRVLVRVGCNAQEAQLWCAALELARRMAGQSLPVWACAERIAAEAASALGGTVDGSAACAPVPLCEASPDARGSPPARACSQEHGLRNRAFPQLSWSDLAGTLPEEIRDLAVGLEDCTAREVDRRLRAAIAFLQGVDLDVGRLLRQLVDRRLFVEIGFPNLERYAAERLDLSPRTARRLVALARSEHRAPAVATAFREARIHAFQAQALARVANVASAGEWVERAARWTLRRLEDEVEAADLLTDRPAAIAFRAPPDVAALFLGMLARVGSLERLLAHAITTWVEAGDQFVDYADFERDGFRCTVPGCTARSNLQSHHIWFRSQGGPDLPWNRTTLCAYHHQRGVHDGRIRIRGRAPADLQFELGSEGELGCEGELGSERPERFRSGDVRV